MLVVGTVLGLLCHSFMYGPQAAFVVEQFSPRLRSTGSSLAYTFAGIIGGAIAPFMFTLLQSTFHSWVPVAIYLSVACLLTVVGLALGRDSNVAEDEEYLRASADVAESDSPMTPANALLSPAEARRQFRDGLVTPTSGWSDGYTQANLIAVTADYADEFLEFCRLNPKPCPVIDVIPAGTYESSLAAGSDIRTDISAYRVWKDGVLAAEVPDVLSLWRDDMVGVLIGCSFTFEAALAAEGIPLRHTETGRNVPMYRTNVECTPAGRIHGPMVVSMRPMPEEMVDTAIRVTAEVPKVHGAPVHVGSPRSSALPTFRAPTSATPWTSGPAKSRCSGPAA